MTAKKFQRICDIGMFALAGAIGAAQAIFEDRIGKRTILAIVAGAVVVFYFTARILFHLVVSDRDAEQRDT